MNNGVQILLDRMKSHPEEFIGDNRRWEFMIEAFKGVIPKEDADALNDGLANLWADRFTERVLEELMEEGSTNPKPQWWERNMTSGGLTQGAYTSHSAHNALHQQQQLLLAKAQAAQNQTASQGFLSSLFNRVGHE